MSNSKQKNYITRKSNSWFYDLRIDDGSHRGNVRRNKRSTHLRRFHDSSKQHKRFRRVRVFPGSHNENVRGKFQRTRKSHIELASRFKYKSARSETWTMRQRFQNSTWFNVKFCRKSFAHGWIRSVVFQTAHRYKSQFSVSKKEKKFRIPLHYRT